ncbi:MAG TPA: hypothetical protein VMM81_01240 [Acidimicrobiia bacterium]|nr:hypothetical protein [Acidimicrobiia bacterium]
MDDRPIDPFDDLFEPFDLEGESDQEEAPQPGERRTVPVRADDGDEPRPITTAEHSAVLCPSCGTVNDPGNRHCDECGARLTRSQMPVAPQPMLRTTAGARALIVLAGVVLTVALLALVFNVVGGSPEETTTTVTTETTVAAEQVQLTPIRVECESELPSYPCTALIDGDSETSWNAVDGGINTEVTFYFQPAVQITQMWIENLQDECRFLRNARIRAVEIEINDRPQLQIANLLDTREIQRIDLNSLNTSRVVMTITSAHPGSSCEGQEPFTELALQSVSFFGRPVPTP